MTNKRKIKVITYGTFDLFHVGHVRLLKKLKALGDELFVGISTDEFNILKGKKSFFSYEERYEIVAACKFVDEVFAETSWQQKKSDIEERNIDIFAIGKDWEGKFDDLNKVCKVVYLDRTEKISTTEIKKSLSLVTPESLTDLENSVHSLVEIVRALSLNK